MKNIRNIALALVAVLLVGFLAVSCDEASLNDLIRNGNHTHAVGKKHEAVASTCMAKGSVEWYECADETCLVKLDADCKELESIDVDVDPNAHAKGVKHEATSGDCQTKGTVEYWDCSVAGCTAKLDTNANVLTSTEGVKNTAVHPTDATTTWTTTTDTHTETYDCCDTVKTAEESHSYVDGICVCGQAEPEDEVFAGTIYIRRMDDKALLGVADRMQSHYTKWSQMSSSDWAFSSFTIPEKGTYDTFDFSGSELKIWGEMTFPPALTVCDAQGNPITDEESPILKNVYVIIN